MAAGRFALDTVVDEAVARAGEDDFGEPTWQEGLAILLDGLVEEARLSEMGVEIAAGGIVDYLATRLALTAWRRDHPEVADGTVVRPIVIVGQPRTGTTILYDLLAQDPALRAPLTWEVDKPVPPPETATYGSDPRIAEVQAIIDMVETVMPGFMSFHAMGAQLAQECVRITAGDFRSMIFNTQFRLPTYNQWLLHDADLGPAYRWHRRYLQHLESRHPATEWLLKSPAHLWHLDALAAEYPDAIVVQTHRDPLKVIASVSALVAHLRRMSSDQVSTAEIAAGYAEDIFLGLDRGLDARDRRHLPPATGGRRPLRLVPGRPPRHHRGRLRPVGGGPDRRGRAADARLPGHPSRRRRGRGDPLHLGRHRARRGHPAQAGRPLPGVLRGAHRDAGLKRAAGPGPASPAAVGRGRPARRSGAGRSSRATG